MSKGHKLPSQPTLSHTVQWNHFPSSHIHLFRGKCQWSTCTVEPCRVRWLPQLYGGDYVRHKTEMILNVSIVKITSSTWKVIQGFDQELCVKETWVCPYLHRPVVGQFRLFLQFLLQVSIGLCLFGPNRSGSEATVVACWVTFIQNWTLLRVHSRKDHTCRHRRRREREGGWKNTL